MLRFEPEDFRVSTEISPGDFSSYAWLESAVFALDRWLRQRRGVFEYSRDPHCLFRLEQRSADDALVLADGTCVRAGAPVLALHLWNEHLPLMGRSGPTVAWAYKFCRAMRASLQELVRYLAQRPDLSDVRVLYADLRVSGDEHALRAGRSLGRYGFEIVSASVDRRSAPQRMADALFVLLMAGVTNPWTLRGRVRHANVRLFISRKVLEQRYAAVRGRPEVGPGRGDYLTVPPQPKPATDIGSERESPSYCR
jgi:hypothetical protein